jgi:hypothetical protein
VQKTVLMKLDMINLISQTLAPWGSINLTGLTAGTPSGSIQPLAHDRHFAIRMNVRERLGPTTTTGVTIAGVCQHIAIDNTLYDNLSHHPSWAEWTQSGALGVALLDIQQLVTNGCAEITNSLDVRFTAAHPNLGPATIRMDGPGAPPGGYVFALPAPANPQDQAGTATPSGFTVAALSPCAYLVRLSVELLLTTGDSEPLPLTDYVAFCKV